MFVQVRSMPASPQDLAKQLSELQEKAESLAMQHEKFGRNTKVQLREVYETLPELMSKRPANPS